MNKQKFIKMDINYVKSLENSFDVSKLYVLLLEVFIKNNYINKVQIVNKKHYLKEIYDCGYEIKKVKNCGVTR